MSRRTTTTREVLGALEALPRAARVAALCETIRVAGAQEAEELALALIELALPPAGAPAGGRTREFLRRLVGIATPPAHERALVGLLGVWTRLSPRARQLALSTCRDRWVVIADQAATDHNADVRLAVAEIAGMALDPALVPTVGRLLADPHPDVARAADRSFALLLRDQSVRTPGAPAEIERSFADALRSSATVRATDVAKAVASLMDRAAMATPDSPLAAFINDPQTDLTPIQATLRRAKDAVTRQRAFEWLTRPRLAAACVDALANARLADDHARVLSLWHLLEHPARATRLGLIRVRAVPRQRAEPDGQAPAMEVPANAPCPLPRDVAALPVEARRGLPRYLARLDADAPSRTLVLERLLTDPDVPARLAGVREAPGRLLADFCFDPDPCVSRAAALRVSPAGARAGQAVPPTLSRAPHAWVRRVVEEDEPDALADTPRARLAWRTRLTTERDSVLADMRALLASPQDPRCTHAIVMARRLGLASVLEPELTAVAGYAGANARAVASAVAAIGDLPPERAGLLLEPFTVHADQRVRANAVEGLAAALGATRSEHIEEVLGGLAGDPNHRVRANAIRPLVLEFPGRVDAVCAMMRDPRPEHRLAGAWLASKLVGSDQAERLGRRGHDLLVELKRSGTDPIAAVRRRADFALTIVGERSMPRQEVGV